MTVWIPGSVKIHFANGVVEHFSARNWNWDIGENEVALWKKDGSYKLRYTGNIAVVELYVPQKETEAKRK